MRTFVAVSLIMAAPAAGQTKCDAGYTHKKDLTNKFCKDAATDASSCNAGCCEADKVTCGGIGLTCNFGTYATNDGAWKDKATTKKTFQTDCCKQVSTCSSTLFTCPAGMKRKAANTVQGIKCPADSASCATSMCCENDDSTCGGYYSKTSPANVCPANQFPQKTGVNAKALDDDAWKGIRSATGSAFASAAKFQAQCCAISATCASPGYNCPAGQKKKAGATDVCGPTADLCASNNNCCVADDTTCGGSTPAPSCSADSYYPSTSDSWKGRAIVKGEQNNQCCAEKATCAVAKCSAGTKKKKNVDGLSCAGNAASCAVGNRCCEPDAATCGGLSASISCPFGYYNEASFFGSKTEQATIDAWNGRAATAATKNTACCTPRAACSNGVTTTPAPVVTQTPAAPARLYSAHKVATKQSEHSGLLWLGSGAVLGMAVLAFVQQLRSRNDARSMTAEE